MVVGVVLLVLLCKPPKGRNVVVLESLEAIMGNPDEKRIDIFLVVCVCRMVYIYIYTFFYKVGGVWGFVKL